MAVIAIDLGGTKALGAVFDASGKMCARQVKLLDGAKGDAVGDIVLDLIKALCGSCRGERVEAVGICVPGIVFSKQDVVWAPNIPGWERYPLKKRISGLVGPDVKVEIESDRTCYILGEVWKGAAKDAAMPSTSLSGLVSGSVFWLTAGCSMALRTSSEPQAGWLFITLTSRSIFLPDVLNIMPQATASRPRFTGRCAATATTPGC